jgi:putative ABC transport system permease protein
MKQHQPPKLARYIFEWYSGNANVDDLLGDLDELFYLNLKTKSLFKAKFKYWISVCSLMFSYAIRKRKRDASLGQFSSSLISIGMLHSYLKVAGRNLYQHKYFTLLNAFGLAIGMSISLLLISMYSYTNTYDNFHANKDNIYTITTHRTEGVNERYLSSAPLTMADRLQENFSGIKEVVRIYRGFYAEALQEKENLPLSGYYVDARFLNVFSFPLQGGNASMALEKPNSLVLTEETALRLFGTTDVVGETLAFNELGNFEITGVLQSHPKNTHFRFDVLVSFSSLPENFLSPEKIWDEYYNQYVYLLLDSKKSPAELERYLNNLAQKQNAQQSVKVSFELQPLSEITTSDAYNGIGTKWETSGFIVFGCIALLILLPACFNYTNISIARALKRSKEIGLRKTMGGVKSQIFFQFITETVVICLISLVGAVGLFILMRTEFQSMMVHASSLDLSVTPLMASLFIFFAVMTGLLAGAFPALYFAGLNPIQALKSKPTNKARGMGVRKSLTVFQFALSFLFILSLVLFSRQYRSHLNFDFGFKKENLVNVSLHHIDPTLLKSEFSRLAAVQSVSFSSGLPGISTTQAWLKNEHSDSIEVSQLYVDSQFLQNFNIELVAGKNFPTETTRHESFMVVNEQFLINNKLTVATALGKTFVADGQELQLIGIVKDFHFTLPQKPIGSFVFRNNVGAFNYANLVMDVSNPISAFSEMEIIWKKLNDRVPLEAVFFEDSLNESFDTYKVLLKLAGFLGLLAISISILGLLGMVVYTSETRVKEVSIRKVLGANAWGIIYLLSKDYLMLLCYAIMVGVPLAILIYQTIFTQIPDYHTDLTAPDILLSAVLLLLLGVITIASQTHKVASTNPAETLKTE